MRHMAVRFGALFASVSCYKLQQNSPSSYLTHTLCIFVGLKTLHCITVCMVHGCGFNSKILNISTKYFYCPAGYCIDQRQIPNCPSCTRPLPPPPPPSPPLPPSPITKPMRLVLQLVFMSLTLIMYSTLYRNEDVSANSSVSRTEIT